MPEHDKQDELAVALTSTPTPAPADTEPKAWTFSLPLLLVTVVGVALLLTGINMTLYFTSNLSRIDLSKPKYADIRKDLLPSNSSSTQTSIDSTSPITKDAILQQISELKKRQQELRKIGGFDSPVLDDSSLGISGTATTGGESGGDSAQ